MKKTVAALLFVLIAAFVFSCRCHAAVVDEAEEDAWFSDLWDSIDAETEALLEQLGIEQIDAEALLQVSPFQIFSLIGDILRGEATSPLRHCAVVILVLVIVSFAGTFLPEGGAMRSRCETVGRLCVIFTLLAGVGQALRESLPAVTTTEDFILALVPVLTGMMGMAGNPSMALSWGGAVLAFAETAGVFFAKFIPAAGALGAAVCAAAALNDDTDLSGAAGSLAKAVTAVMGFAAGIFTAVLTVTDVIAGTADTVGLKGLKFVVGQSVPVVGSAIADALNSVAAGMALLRNTAGVFAVAVLFLIVLVPFLRLVLWKLVFRFLSVVAGVLGNRRAASLTDSLNSLLSVMLGAICFNSAVFIIAVTLVLQINGR